MAKLAIHHRPGSFSERWIAYCEKKGISYKIVNAFDSDIILKLRGFDCFLWHHHQGHYKDVLAAKKILFALEHAGVKVFPDFKTNWHFDDKVAQKYLLEAIDAPLVTSYVFYDKDEAVGWAEQTTYPKVFKLKGGAGAANVKLVRTRGEAIKYINRSFGKGFAQFDRLNNLKERYNKFKNKQDTLLGLCKGLARLFIPTDFSKKQPFEKGYAYFQEFIPNNNCDIRVIVIGDKAFAIKRMVRKNDFRASGSGLIVYQREGLDERCVKVAIKVNKEIGSQSVAYDFVFDINGSPKIVEISYGFAVEPYDLCPGYWDSELNWHEGKFNPQEWMLDNIIKQSVRKSECSAG